MTPDLISLAASITVLPKWRWMPGMLTRNGDRIKVAAQYDDGRWRLDTSNSESIYSTGLGDAWKCNWYDINTGYDRGMAADAPLPDFTDAATGGCMLEMLGRCEVYMFANSVVVHHISTAAVGNGATLAEACARVAQARGVWSS